MFEKTLKIIKYFLEVWKLLWGKKTTKKTKPLYIYISIFFFFWCLCVCVQWYSILRACAENLFLIFHVYPMDKQYLTDVSNDLLSHNDNCLHFHDDEHPGFFSLTSAMVGLFKHYLFKVIPFRSLNMALRPWLQVLRPEISCSANKIIFAYISLIPGKSALLTNVWRMFVLNMRSVNRLGKYQIIFHKSM